MIKPRNRDGKLNIRIGERLVQERFASVCLIYIKPHTEMINGAAVVLMPSFDKPGLIGMTLIR